MDENKLILAEPVSQPIMLEHLNKVNSIPAGKREQFAKDFESVFINKLLDEMKNTIGDWGFEKDGVSEQVQGIFWLCLSRDIADKGGFGLWKEISRAISDLEHKDAVTESLDKNV